MSKNTGPRGVVAPGTTTQEQFLNQFPDATIRKSGPGWWYINDQGPYRKNAFLAIMQGRKPSREYHR